MCYISEKEIWLYECLLICMRVCTRVDAVCTVHEINVATCIVRFNEFSFSPQFFDCWLSKRGGTRESFNLNTTLHRNKKESYKINTLWIKIDQRFFVDDGKLRLKVHSNNNNKKKKKKNETNIHLRIVNALHTSSACAAGVHTWTIHNYVNIVGLSAKFSPIFIYIQCIYYKIC